MSKISELSDGGSLVSSDYLIAVRSGGNVKVRMDQINVDQVDLGDNEFIRLGNSQDLTMVHTSTQSIINQAGTGDLLIQKAGATKASITANGLEFPDNSKAIFGAGSDLQIYHDGTNNRLTFASANTYIQTDGTIHFTDIGNSEKHFTINDNGAVDLYYDNVKKLATTATGCDVAGTVTADSLTTDDDVAGLSTLGRYSSGFAFSLLRPSATATGIEIRTNAGNALAHFLNDGTTTLLNNGSAKLTTLSTGIDVTGSVTASAGLNVTPDSSANAANFRTRSTNDYSFVNFYSNDGSENLASIGIERTSVSTSGLHFYVNNGGQYVAKKMSISPEGNLTTRQSTGNNFRVVRNGDNSIEVGNYNATDGYQNTSYVSSTHTFYAGTAGSGTAPRAVDIDASGKLLVGTPTPAPNSTTTIKGSLGLVGPSGVSTSSITFNNPSNVKYWGIATEQAYFYITDADFTHFCYVGQSMTAWTFGSDRRLKENIVDVPYGLNAVMAMQPRAFKFKSSGVETIGFVAQELQEVVPEAVSGTEVEYLDSDTPQEKANKSLGVSQDTLIPVLVKAMQEQQATIEALTARIAALES